MLRHYLLIVSLFLLPTTTARADNEPEPRYNAIAVTGDTILVSVTWPTWVGNHHVMRVHNDSDGVSVMRVPGQITGLEYRNGETFVALRGRGMAHFKQGILDTHIVCDRRSYPGDCYSNYVNAMSLHDGVLYCATLNGVFQYRIESRTFTPFDPLNALLPVGDCFDIAIAGNTLWITVMNHWAVYMCGDISGQEDGGIVGFELGSETGQVFRGAQTTWLSEDSSITRPGNTSIPNGWFSVLAPDMLGGVWCSVQNAVAHYDSENWTVYDSLDVGTRLRVFDMDANQDGLWLAARNALCHFDADSGRWSQFAYGTTEIPGEYPLSVHCEGSRVWVKTSQRHHWRIYERGVRVHGPDEAGLYLHTANVGSAEFLVKCSDPSNWTEDYIPSQSEYLSCFDGQQWKSWNLTRSLIDHLLADTSR